MIDIADLTASEQRRRVAARELSAAECVAAGLARVERLNGTLNAVVTLNPQAMNEARALDDRLARGQAPRLLCGLTAGIKDVTPVAGLRTTFGSTLYADYVPKDDALVVTRLREADAIIIGKTNCPEFAAGANTFNDVFGRTLNPWDPAKSAGGSTGGGAAALATGMIALAEGTDLGGSLRIPAAFCGLVGLRPSVGLVPTWPTDWAWDTLQVTGPMARTAADVALMLQVISGPSARSPISQAATGQDYVATVDAGLSSNLRVAYCADLTGIGIDPAIESVCRNAAFGLRQRGIAVEEISLDLSAGRPAFLALRGLWFATHMRSRLGEMARFGANVANNVRAGLAVTTTDLAAAEDTRGRIWHQLRELLTRFDHLLTPCVAVSPFPVEQNYPDTIAGRPMQTYIDWIAPTFVLSLTGLPVGSVPCGLDLNGLPVGLQIVGRQLGDGAVLALAAELQRNHPIGRPGCLDG